jgi:hypothetical protein
MFRSADQPSARPISHPLVEGATLLVARVISQAVEDHGVPAWRDEVDAFFAGPAFARYCALLGWNDAIRQAQYKS